MKNVYKANSTLIFTGLASIGVISSVVITAKTVPKAIDILDQAEKEKGSKLTNLEKIDYIFPVCIPVIISTTVTIGLIFGLYRESRNREIALLTAYTTLDSTFKRYRDSVIDIYDADDNIEENMNKQLIYKINDDIGWSYDPEKIIFYEEFANIFFESTMEDILLAEAKLNKYFIENESVSLEDLHRYFGNDISSRYLSSIGWSREIGIMKYGYSVIEFKHQKLEQDGVTYIFIKFLNAPTPDYLDNYILDLAKITEPIMKT